MSKYRVLIRGENFLLNVDGKDGRYGFYQTILVEGTDPSHAELEAVRLVKGNTDLKELTQNEANDPPMLYLDSIEELDDTEVLRASPNGRSYFREKS